jgi:hypothetical protein
MRVVTSALASIIVLTSIASVHAQSLKPTGSQPSISVPRLIKFSSVFQPADGQPPASREVVTLSVYADQEGGVPLWQEIQTVAVDTTGRFTVLLGASHPDGLPLELFASGEARWMSLEFARPGEVERPRVQLTSVPYALKAEDAATLGGRPASDFLLAPTQSDKARHATSATAGDSSATAQPTVAADVLPGTTNFLAKYVNNANVGNSAVYEVGGRVGMGTGAITPFDRLHLRFTDGSGAFTGLAVQNMANTATSYSGMLFYDQFGALAQFQGFNNVTHEYRINNVASTGSINFMLGTSRLKMDATNGTTISGPASVVAGAVDTGLSVSSTSTDPTSAAIDTLDDAGYGIFATTDTGTAVFGGSLNVAPSWAGFFDGDVNVTGTLTKAAGAFRIDHPLDPENKYLSHSFVESPDMKNIYDGVAVFDAAGEAIVTLPDWFEALNEDFRYQLTPMGAAFVPYVAEEIAGNQFKIGGGIPGRKVSWQVTGIRHDAYANAHRIQIEELKPAAAVGTYLHPDAFGQPVEKGRSTVSADDSKATAKDRDAARRETIKARLRAISPKPQNSEPPR